jgi:mannose-6-phosphate isomerase-like protein (cupin superfamily)
MKGYIQNIEKLTCENTAYRKVLYTTHGLQLVVMSLLPGEEIGEEVHGLDQFIRVEEGVATVILEGEEKLLQEDEIVIIPRGTKHNVINKGEKTVKLYSLYGPAEHKDGTLHLTKQDEKEEHFDGMVSYQKES